VEGRGEVTRVRDRVEQEVRNLDRDFDIEKDEVTPTGKLKREIITNRYRNQIESLYGPAHKAAI